MDLSKFTCCGSRDGHEIVANNEDALTGAGAQAGGFQSCVAACCCLQIKSRDTVQEWMLSDNANTSPSLFQRLVLLQCGPKERTSANLDSVPQLKGLAGISLQAGEHETAGSLQTLKWGEFDPKTRVLIMKVFGGFSGCDGYSGGATGQWTEPVVLHWCFLMNLARCANYSYKFTFSEDYKRADIDIIGDPLPLCCICIPCLPPWWTIPRCCIAFEMEQAEGYTDGTNWIRRSAVCGGPMKYTYNLKEVITTNGKRGPFYGELEQAPEQLMITF